MRQHLITYFIKYICEWLISKLKLSNLGCHVASFHFGCIMYADLLLLSVSVFDMQHMFDICALFGETNSIRSVKTSHLILESVIVYVKD
jgi:hypothetical protein